MEKTKPCPDCHGTGKVPGESDADRKIDAAGDIAAANIIPGYHDEARQKTCQTCLGRATVPA